MSFPHDAEPDAVKIRLSTSDFFGISNSTHLRDILEIDLSDHSYRPKNEDPRSDWVATVAAPAFRALASEGFQAEYFCTIGTGAGLDALAAIEILRSAHVFVTDVHDDVVLRATRNIITNVIRKELHIDHAVGDLLTPVIDRSFKADLIYENLPNIPVSDETLLSIGQASSTFIADRKERLPDFVTQHLLALHYVLLQSAGAALRPHGRIVSSIGGRVPLDIILRLAISAGRLGRILLYTWKRQSEPEEVIGGYARWEQSGHGPFRFYPVAALEAAFCNLDPVTSENIAREIENTLAPHSLSAVEAFHAFQNGEPIGHTVAVLESAAK